MDLSLSTKEYADPHLDKDTMCKSGPTICVQSISRVHEGKEHVAKPHESIGLQTHIPTLTNFHIRNLSSAAGRLECAHSTGIANACPRLTG